MRHKLLGYVWRFISQPLVNSRNANESVKKEIVDILHVKEANTPGKYLGLPAVVGRSKKSVFAYIHDRVIAKINSWKCISLSRAGREVFLKRVAQSIPTYVNNMNEGKSRNKVDVLVERWNKLTRLEALVSKLFQALYYHKSDFLHAKLGPNPSFLWRGLCVGKHIFKQRCLRRIGDGKTTRVYADPWLLKDNSSYVESSSYLISESLLVAYLMKQRAKEWDLDLLHALFNEVDMEVYGLRKKARTLTSKRNKTG
ncbi:hypothetical protein KY290_017226 [Solanum tuberosum]|uniref:RNA-directed DNA polymerase (Reverse transcriptase) n=1 Tax=Solanum tuberosum TaxID=4113 RepID=A0ABQ7VCS9_SOLTU|nr:hypothetical protein KY290_017226 [Solanum tuberosum]